jgi:NAD(P)-dependent dehydrogenase (short-subunit alcohol dehydrogenase family)
VLFDFEGKTVLVSGGTRGIGLATGLAFGKFQAQTILTYRWGGDHESVVHEFARNGAKPPLLVCADVSDGADTVRLIDEIAARSLSVDVFVAITERALSSSIRYGVWPLVEYLQRMKAVFGRYPRHTVAISTTGMQRYVRNYALVAASKAALEALCRYVAFYLRNEDSRVNMVRTRAIETDSAKAIVGHDLRLIAEATNATNQLVRPEEVAEVIVAMCSGLFDDMNGEILTVDRGGIFRDNLDRLFDEKDQIGL